MLSQEIVEKDQVARERLAALKSRGCRLARRRRSRQGRRKGQEETLTQKIGEG